MKIGEDEREENGDGPEGANNKGKKEDAFNERETEENKLEEGDKKAVTIREQKTRQHGDEGKEEKDNGGEEYEEDNLDDEEEENNKGKKEDLVDEKANKEDEQEGDVDDKKEEEEDNKA